MSSIIVELPDDVIERIARRAAEIVEARQPTIAAVSPYMRTDEAAEYMRCDRQRVYDLVSAGVLARHKDGRRLLVRRDEVDSYLDGLQSRPSRRRLREHMAIGRALR